MPANGTQEHTMVHPDALAVMLNNLAQAASTGRDARELTEWLLRQISRVTGWPVAQVLLVDPSGAVTLWFSSRNNDTRWEAYTVSLSEVAMRNPTGLIDRVITTRRPGWVTDIGDEADYPRAAAARSVGLRGTFVLPVVRSRHVVAVLQFLSPQPIDPDTYFQDAMRVAGHLLGSTFDKLRLEGEFADSPSRLHRVMDTGASAFFALDVSGRVVEWSRTAERLFGWTRSEANHRRIADLLFIADPSVAEVSTGCPGPRRWETMVRRRDGSTFDAEVSRWHVTAGRPADDRDFFVCRDVTERHHRATGLMQDPLTGLLNRAGILSLMEERLSNRYSDGSHGSVLMMVGLQRFKEIDYSADHLVADEALRIIGGRLATIAQNLTQTAVADRGPGATTAAVGRIAGDEFAILFEVPSSTTEISAIAERVIDVVAEPFQAAGRRLAVSAHIGVAAPLAGSDVDSWLGDADAALYRSRHGIIGHFGSLARFEIEGFARRQGASWRQNLPAEMQTALDHGQFELYFQPVFSLPAREIVGAEALLRWHHPQHGLLLPGAFIRAAEDSGMIAPIGEWVLQTGCEHVRTWARPDLELGINLGAQQLANPGTVAHVTNAAASLTRGTVLLEMTESVLMADPAVAATRIGQFRDMGMRVAIDDFGTGYSSLAYLKWFDIDVIKIDMSFVRGMATSHTDTEIVRCVIDLARALDLRVIAEGAETEEQLRLLTELGCSHVQGFALGRPMPAADFAALIGR